jgi:hypothetical protein
MPKRDVRASEPGEMRAEWKAFYSSPVNLTMPLQNENRHTEAEHIYQANLKTLREAVQAADDALLAAAAAEGLPVDNPLQHS